MDVQHGRVLERAHPGSCIATYGDMSLLFGEGKDMFESLQFGLCCGLGQNFGVSDFVHKNLSRQPERSTAEADRLSQKPQARKHKNPKLNPDNTG